MSDDFLFAKEKDDAPLPNGAPYQILIVDDDEEIHVITKMALSDFSLNGKALQFTSAYSGAEAREVLSQRDDFALVLLDVVMEDDHAGLDVARWIRETLQNRMIRIVLRTGQPGQAPEEDIIARYEIDDYKEKTELTYRKLVTLMYSSLRAYRDIVTIERNKLALERIIKASAELFSANSIQELSHAILQQLVSLLTHADSAAYCRVDGLTAEQQQNSPFQILAATGQYLGDVGQALQHQVDAAIIEQLAKQQEKVSFVIKSHTYFGLYRTRSNLHYLLYIEGIHDLTEADHQLLALFMNNTAMAFEHARKHLPETSPAAKS